MFTILCQSQIKKKIQAPKATGYQQLFSGSEFNTAVGKVGEIVGAPLGQIITFDRLLGQTVSCLSSCGPYLFTDPAIFHGAYVCHTDSASTQK